MSTEIMTTRLRGDSGDHRGLSHGTEMTDGTEMTASSRFRDERDITPPPLDNSGSPARPRLMTDFTSGTSTSGLRNESEGSKENVSIQSSSFGARSIRQSERSLAELRESFREQLGRNISVTESEGSARVSSGASGSDYVKWKKPYCMPDLYDGSIPLENFFSHFEMVATINCWGDREKAVYLGYSLRGPALDVVSNMEAQRRFDYVSLKNQLSIRFNSLQGRLVTGSEMTENQGFKVDWLPGQR